MRRRERRNAARVNSAHAEKASKPAETEVISKDEEGTEEVSTVETIGTEGMNEIEDKDEATPHIRCRSLQGNVEAIAIFVRRQRFLDDTDEGISHAAARSAGDMEPQPFKDQPSGRDD